MARKVTQADFFKKRVGAPKQTQQENKLVTASEKEAVIETIIETTEENNIAEAEAELIEEAVEPVLEDNPAEEMVEECPKAEEKEEAEEREPQAIVEPMEKAVEEITVKPSIEEPKPKKLGFFRPAAGLGGGMDLTPKAEVKPTALQEKSIPATLEKPAMEEVPKATFKGFRRPEAPSFLEKKSELMVEKEEKPVIKTTETPVEEVIETPVEETVETQEDIDNLIAEARIFMEHTDQKVFADELDRICRDAKRERFTVSVVGEFSKGKSTFVNKLLGKDVLPVGDLPTTAMLTRIRFSEKEMLVHFDRNGKKQGAYPISNKSWEGLTAENFGVADPTGTILMGVNNPWLKKYNLEINDTPGAGDLEDNRALVIGDALSRSDGAIIATSAVAAMSMSEKLFIEQRLIAKKTPFLMLVITKLDQVPIKERKSIIEYVKGRLEVWNMDIPVYVPYEVQMPDDEYDNIIGMDKIKNCIFTWMNDPQRVMLTRDWIKAKSKGVVEKAIAILNEKVALCDSDEEKRNELIKAKKEKLSEAKTLWEDLRVQMLQRCNNCYNFLQTKVSEGTLTSKERLQYEASHAHSPEKWWREDYPYRVKIELSNMAANVESQVARTIAEDAHWFNNALEKNFRTQVVYNRETVVDKHDFNTTNAGTDIGLTDLSKGRVVAKIGSTALSIGCSIALTCSGLGMFGIVATLGLGTGTSLLSEGIFKSKADKQREMLKDVVGKHVQAVAESSLADSERRLKGVYNNIISEAYEQEQVWLTAQEEAIDKSVTSPQDNNKEKIEKQIEFLSAISKKLG